MSGVLKQARDLAHRVLVGDEPASSQQAPAAESNAVVQEKVASSRAGTVTAEPGDTLGTFAREGTGDAMRYRELNLFNERDAEDASLEVGQTLAVPLGWDLEAMGGVPDGVPAAAAESDAEIAPEVEAEVEGSGMPGVWEIVALGQQKLSGAAGTAASAADSAYDVAYGAIEAGRRALWGGEEEAPEPAEVEQAVEQAADEVLEPSVGPERGLTPAQQEHFLRHREEGGEKVVDQTVEGASPLEIARKQAEKGDAGTTYKIDEAALAKVQAGDPSADTFWCSGFMIWTLAAYGMDVNAAILGANGQEYTYKNPGGKVYPITVKRMMDGEPEAVGAMDYAAKAGIQGGYIGQVGVDFSEGYGSDKFQGDAADHSLAVKGAAGAFVAAGIGTEVPERDQRPGDFNQSRYKGPYRYYDGANWVTDTSKPIDYYGQGHAWMSGHVVVRGSAWVGLPGSPLVDGAAATEVAWVEDAALTLCDDTDPALVGVLGPAESAERIEANTAGAGELASKKAGGDGGLQVTGQMEVPAKATGSQKDLVVYTGRLGGSPWASHKPASRDVPPPGAPGHGEVAEAAPAEAAPEEQSWSEWAKGLIS